MTRKGKREALTHVMPTFIVLLAIRLRTFYLLNFIETLGFYNKNTASENIKTALILFHGMEPQHYLVS